MGKVTGFIEHTRKTAEKRPAKERVKNYSEFELPVLQDDLKVQAARCMDCGIPFCNTGCPVGNLIPDWNDHVYEGKWEEALDSLHSTNNFPEFTGRVCPAPCEASCVLNIDNAPVSIKLLEKSIIDRAISEGGLVPQRSSFRSGKKVAVVGSGPAGLATAQQLSRAGHEVTVFEKDDRLGGLLCYGIPDFKLEKSLIERRVEQMRQEGVTFKTSVDVGVDVTAADLQKNFDATCLAGGSRVPRNLPAPGRELRGVHYAMEFLEQQNRRCAGDTVADDISILATDKNVVVIGGGDTGSDCIGTSHRQGAKSVTNFELMPKSGDERAPHAPWPLWPLMLRTSSSHEEGGSREFSVMTKEFCGVDGQLTHILCCRVEFKEGRPTEVAGSEFTIKADLVFLAMGFIHPKKEGLLQHLGVELTERGNVKVDDQFRTSVPGIFAAGDMQRGQSLVVWAITDGRKAARAIDEHLMQHSELHTSRGAGVVR